MPSAPPPGLQDWLSSPAGQLFLRDQLQTSPQLHPPSPNLDATAPPIPPTPLATPSSVTASFQTQHPAPLSTSSITQPGANNTSTATHSQQYQPTMMRMGTSPLVPSQAIPSTADALAPANTFSQVPAPLSHVAPSIPGTGNHTQLPTYHHLQTHAGQQIHHHLHPQQAGWSQPPPTYLGSGQSGLPPAYLQQAQVVPSTLAAPVVYTQPPPSISISTATAAPIEPYHGASGITQAMPDYSYGSQNPPPARGLMALARSSASAVNEDRMRSASSSRGLSRPRGRSQAVSRPVTAPYPRSRSNTPTNTPSPALIGDFANIEVHIYVPLPDCNEYQFQFLRLRRSDLQAQLNHYGAMIDLPALPVATTHLSQIMALAQQRAESGPHSWRFRHPTGPANSTNLFANSVFDCLVPAVKARLQGKEHALLPLAGGAHMTLQWILKDPQSPFIHHHAYSGVIRPDGSYWFTIRLITRSPMVTALILERPGRHHSCVPMRMFNRKMTDTRKEDSDPDLAAPRSHTDPLLTSDEDEEEIPIAAESSSVNQTTESASVTGVTIGEQGNLSSAQNDWTTHSDQDLDQLPPLVPSSITIHGVVDGLSSQPIEPFSNISKIWNIISNASCEHYPLAPEGYYPPLEPPRFRLTGRNDAAVAELLWKAMKEAAEFDDCSRLLTPSRSYTSGPGIGFGIERQVLSLLARDKFRPERADYWTPRRGEYYSPALSLPESMAGNISEARLLEMKTLGILTGFHIVLLGAAPPLYSPFHFHLAMHGNDSRSLSTTLLDHFDPELQQLQDQWRQLPLNQCPTLGSALSNFIIHYLETPPQALSNRSQAAHDAFATQMVLAAYVGINGMNHPEMKAFVSGLELPCENGLRLSHVIKAFRPTSIDALTKIWDTAPSNWESLSRDNRLRVMSAVDDSSLEDLLLELRAVTGNPSADFKDYLETWLEGTGCMSIDILRDQISQGLFPPQVSEEDVMKPSFRVATFYEVATSSYRYIPGVTAKATFVNDADSPYDSNTSSRAHNIAQGVIRASSCFHQVFIPASALIKRLRADSSPPEGEHATTAASVEWFFTFGFANGFGKFTTA